jgi:hypothetical protein
MQEKLENVLLEEIQLLAKNELSIIREALDLVKNEGVSNYPILVAFEKNNNYELGVPLALNHPTFEFNISMLEELFVKNVVNQEKVNNFRAVFNHKNEHICVLIISVDFADFVFIPAG